LAAALLPSPARTLDCTPSLHGALPIFGDDVAVHRRRARPDVDAHPPLGQRRARLADLAAGTRVEQLAARTQRGDVLGQHQAVTGDRKSTRLNSSHVKISYAVFCL